MNREEQIKLLNAELDDLYSKVWTNDRYDYNYVISLVYDNSPSSIEHTDIIGNFRRELGNEKYSETGKRIVSYNIGYDYKNRIADHQVAEAVVEHVRNKQFESLATCKFLGTLSIDYRLLKDPSIFFYLSKNLDSRDLTIRIIGDNYTLTEADYKNLWFVKRIIVDNIEPNLKTYYPQVQCQHNLFKKVYGKNEHTFTTCDFFIDKELSYDNALELVNAINNEALRPRSLNIRYYNTEEYKHILKLLEQLGLADDVEINFLGNPKTDKKENFEYLANSKYKVSVTYNTCSDLVKDTIREPYDRNVHYQSELEGGGLVDAKGYYEVLTFFEQIEKFIKDNNFSPLEAAVFCYQYLQYNYNYTYNENYLPSDDTRVLDRVITKKTIVCVGFATLYSAMLRRVGIPMFRYDTTAHVRNIGRINDPKYGIDSISIFDPTWDNNDNKKTCFTFFGLSPEVGLQLKETEFLTLADILAVSPIDLVEYLDKSKSEYQVFYNPEYSAISYSSRMLELMGYDATWLTSKRVYDLPKMLDFISELWEKGTTREGSISQENITDALRVVLRKMHPSASQQFIEKQILDANDSILETVGYLQNSHNISINYDKGQNPYTVPVKTIDPSIKFAPQDNKSEYLEKLKNTFTKVLEQKVQTWSELYLIHLTRLELPGPECTNLNKEINQLLNSTEEFTEISKETKIEIYKELKRKYDSERYSKIGEQTHIYLVKLIRDITNLKETPEYKSLQTYQQNYFNSATYKTEYQEVTTKIADIINNPLAMSAGATLSFANDTLRVNFANHQIRPYSLQILCPGYLFEKKQSELKQEENKQKLEPVTKPTIIVEEMVVTPTPQPDEQKATQEQPTDNENQVIVEPQITIDKPQTESEYINKYIQIINLLNYRINELNDCNEYSTKTEIADLSNNSIVEKIILNERKALLCNYDIIRLKREVLDLRIEYQHNFKRPITRNPLTSNLKIEDIVFNYNFQEFIEHNESLIRLIEDYIIRQYQSNYDREQLLKYFELIEAKKHSIRRVLVEENKKTGLNITEFIKGRPSSTNEELLYNIKNELNKTPGMKR